MKSTIPISRGQLANVFKEYATITALLSDQANQSSNRLYKVIDASLDTNITFPSGETKLHAYYEYKETPNGVIGDYDLIGAPFAQGSGGVPKEENITGTRYSNATTTGTQQLDWDSFKVFVLMLTGGATLEDLNLPTGTETKVIELIITGDETLTLPSYWKAMPNNDAYDGSKRNHLVISCINGDTNDVIYSLQNLAT